MKKNNLNKFDTLIDNLSENFSKVSNFNKLQETNEGRKLFNTIVKTISDFESFQSLFLHYYIPASNKSISDTWNQVSKSKYKSLINITKEDLKENLYETIRLGYVGLFHKYESYLNILVESVDFLLKDLNTENNLFGIDEYCKKEFNIKITKSHHLFSITKKINYISNCVKHYDGLPIKNPIHEEFIDSNKAEKIKISKEEFRTDIERLKKHNELLMAQIIMMGFKQYFDLEDGIIKKSIKDEFKEEEVFQEKLSQLRNTMNLVLSDFNT